MNSYITVGTHLPLNPTPQRGDIAVVLIDGRSIQVELVGTSNQLFHGKVMGCIPPTPLLPADYPSEVTFAASAVVSHSPKA